MNKIGQKLNKLLSKNLKCCQKDGITELPACWKQYTPLKLCFAVGYNENSVPCDNFSKSLGKPPHDAEKLPHGKIFSLHHTTIFYCPGVGFCIFCTFTLKFSRAHDYVPNLKEVGGAYCFRLPVCTLHFLMHAISYEPCMLGFWNFIYGFLMKN